MSQLSLEQINNLSQWNPEGVEYTMRMSDLALESGKKIAPQSKAVSILEQINIGLNKVFAPQDKYSPQDKGGNGESLPEARSKQDKNNIVPWVIGGTAAVAGIVLLTK